ncbi:flagellinolysin [Selenomonas sp. AE3005]|uniref:flagellinolysin n=1 Tax=Selenomonas sp. AE3005 TaxID=1485543 RepID=UPI0025FC31DC|nr:flagellinolysin [Selenomonas sp. AE3005]
MSMVVKNNKEATNTLNTLNKNSAELAKSLQKVSSGMKINGAADDASGYAISEKMRVRIRGLEQANANTQNATSMMKTAEGALQNNIDIMKTLKEKAIDAANDTNTDLDRATIQKEINQLVSQMDDNASATFYGKPLFDQSNQSAENVNQQIIKALNSEWIQNSLEMLKEAYGIDFTEDGTMVDKMTVYLDNQGQNGTLAYVSHTVSGSQTTKLELHVNMDYYSNMDMEDVNGVSASASTYLDRVIAHEMTHAVMAANIEDFDTLPLYIIEGIAELTHGADERVLSVLNTMSASDYSSLFSSGGTAGTQEPYAGGFAFFRYMAAHSGGSGKGAITRFMDVLKTQGASAVDDAVATATKGHFATLNDLTTAFENDVNTSTTMLNFYKKHCGIDLYNLDVGGVLGWDAEGKEWRTNESTVPEGGSVKYWIYPEDATTVIDGLEVEWPAFQRKIGGWMFQTGTKSNDGIHVAINDIHAQALGVMDREGNAIKVDTWSNATAAIRQLDKSLNRALGYQTTIGAIISRMEYTAANLVTASENTQSAESVIRDADMAKEMTAYTKNNVLMQGAQSMLAQANQNSSAVLSLLQ